MNIEGQPRTFGGIQALRGFAWALVLVQHATFYACQVKGLDYQPFLAAEPGKIGVVLFFVISGYVMGECLGQGRRFLWNRALRIFPPYWLAIALAGLILTHGLTGWRLDLRAVLLLPSKSLNQSIGIPYWTLCYEMAFYVVVYVLILCRATRGQILAACVAWLLAVALADVYRPMGDAYEPGWRILLSPLCPFFIAGLFGSAAGKDFLRAVPSSYLALAAVALWSIGVGAKFATPAPGNIIQAAGYYCALAAALRLRAPRALVRLGDFSYGGYLIHSAIIVGVQTALFPAGAGVPFAIVWIVLMTAGGAGGLAYGWLEHAAHLRLFKRRAAIALLPHQPATRGVAARR